MKGSAIRRARKRAGLSQQAIAEQAGVSIATVRLIESGWTPRAGDSAALDAVITAVKRAQV